jgi:hypothetical protein
LQIWSYVSMIKLFEDWKHCLPIVCRSGADFHFVSHRTVVKKTLIQTFPINIRNGRSWGCRLAWSRLGDLGYSKYVFNDFEQWLNKSHHHSTVRQLLKYAVEYHDVLAVPSKASEIMVLNRDKRRMVMSSLANLSKFLGKYEHWKMIVRNTGLKWEKRTSLEVVLDIMDARLSDTKEWLLKAVKTLSKQHATVLIFDALTGLRPSEAYQSCELITKLSECGKLEHYLNREMMMLEHFRYKDIFLRRCKNAYISFISPELLELVLKYKPTLKFISLNPKLN